MAPFQIDLPVAAPARGGDFGSLLFDSLFLASLFFPSLSAGAGASALDLARFDGDFTLVATFSTPFAVRLGEIHQTLCRPAQFRLIKRAKSCTINATETERRKAIVIMCTKPI